MRLLARAAALIDGLNAAVGRTAAWLALGMVLVQFALVIMRYVFGVSSIQLQESLLYMHGALFMLTAGYALLHDDHVRVDIFYRSAGPRGRAWINLCGVLFLLVPFCVLLGITAWPYVAASWAVREGSRETSGIAGIYVLKSLILVFTGLVLLQGLALAMRSLLTLRRGSEPPGDGEGQDG